MGNLDFVRALTTRDDDRIRRDPNVRWALTGARDVIDHMRVVIEENESRLPPPLAKALKARWREADWNLADFAHDASLTSRIAALSTVRAVNTFIFLGVPLMEPQRKTTALYVAVSGKSAVRAIGLGRRATTHAWQVADHFIGRDLINTQQSLLFAIHLIGALMPPGPARDRLERSTSAAPYLTFVGVASVISAMLAFHHKDLSRLLNKLFYGHAAPNLQGRETLGDRALRRLGSLRDALMRDARRTMARPPAGALKVEDLPSEVQDALQYLLKVSERASHGVRHLGREMQKLGTLSDSSAKLFGTVEGSFGRLNESIGLVLGIPVESRANDQWVAKAALAVFALGVCVAPAAFLKDNTIGFVDLVANAAFVFLVMAMNAADPHTRLEVSEDDFGQYCGFSLAMTGVWAYNQVKHDPMEKTWASAMQGAAVLTALGNTLSAPSGLAVGWLAGKAHRGFSRLAGAVPTQPD
ncbi:hypothetical protein [Roseateles sp. YR242]|uniref:hypothetical protein n=1 Tax=Roseateles sp. YR242 TaxID=1855305 RepID=UPI001160B69E|nr:hypothetical protein [Roseateles sp. YR242]